MESDGDGEDGSTLLAGVNGEGAQGRIWARPTSRILGLRAAARPEFSAHSWEAGLAVRAALRASPSVLELLWLPEYDTETVLGQELVILRGQLVSREEVLRSYTGAVNQSLQKAARDIRLAGKLDNRGVEREERLRSAHAAVSRAARLLFAAMDLWETGELPVRAADPALPEAVRITADAFCAGKDSMMKSLAAIAGKRMSSTTPLPGMPDIDAAERWLLRVRREYWRADAERREVPELRQPVHPESERG